MCVVNSEGENCMRKKIIQKLYNSFLKWLLPIFHILVGKNRIRARKSNSLSFTTANVYRSTFDLQKGSNNFIKIQENSDLHNSTILIKGNGNTITIGKNSFINGLTIIMEGNNNSITIGENAFILDDVKIYTVDGSNFCMGKDCMLSDHIDIRTTDNHSILDKKTGRRVNYEEDITIHDNVWLGHGVILLKGVELAEGCIVGAGSVVTRRHLITHSVVAGNPAKEVKENVAWTMERIKSKEYIAKI